MLEMDQNSEQRNLSETTGISVPMKETGGREKCNQHDYACSQTHFEDTFENAQCRKVKRMQPMHATIRALIQAH